MKIATLFVSIILILIVTTSTVEASNTWVYNKGDWKVRLDSPETNGKTYWHLHFYQNGKHVYCLRLDNFQYCDGKNNKDKVPKKVYEAVMENSKVQKGIKAHNPNVESSGVFKWIIKIGAVSLSAIMCVVAFFNVFTGPADDVVAWAAFLKALAY